MTNAASPTGARRWVAALRGSTLGEYLDRGRDNLLLLRAGAALLVVFGHAFVLAAADGAAREPLHRWFDLPSTHLLGVMMFFVVSGYLVTLSWQRSPQLARFLGARALRIFPALIVVVALTAFALGAAFSTLAPTRYLADGTVYGYVAGNASLLRLQETLPGVFASNPATSVVNGSLWTLPVEVLMYLGVAALGAAGLLRRRWSGNAAIGICILLCIAPLGGELSLARILAAFFALGALACINRDALPLSTPILIVLFAACWLLHQTPLRGFALAAAVAYSALWFAYVPRLPRWPRDTDCSYGLYLAGFPFEQALLASAGALPPLLVFAGAAPLALVYGVLSWHFVERPMLALKQRLRQQP